MLLFFVALSVVLLIHSFCSFSGHFWRKDFLLVVIFHDIGGEFFHDKLGQKRPYDRRVVLLHRRRQDACLNTFWALMSPVRSSNLLSDLWFDPRSLLPNLRPLKHYPTLPGDRRAIAYTTSARISRIFSRLTASILATLTLSRTGGERASTVDRYPEPRMIVHQSSGVSSGCVPGSAITSGSVTPHSTRSARSGSGWTILFQGLIDLNSSGSS